MSGLLFEKGDYRGLLFETVSNANDNYANYPESQYEDSSERTNMKQLVIRRHALLFFLYLAHADQYAQLHSKYH
jgi:hypothetical protein